MRTEQLILHIGTHKTGTSAIQSSLVSSVDRLTEHGVLYPVSGRAGVAGGHLNLAWETANDQRFRPDRGGQSDLLKEIERVRPRTVLLSAETFSTRPGQPLHAQWAAHLAARIGVSSVRVIGYVRSQWSYVESVYTQQVKSGQTFQHFEDFVERQLKHPRFSYTQVFGPWSDEFAECLVVRPYEQSLLHGGDAVTDFWATAGLGEAPSFGRATRANTRPGSRETEFLRLLGAVIAESSIEIGFQRGDLFRRARRFLATRISEDTPFRGLTFPLVKEIHDRFSPDNLRFAEQYLGSPEAAAVFELPSRDAVPPPNIWKLDEAGPQELMTAGELLAEAFRTLGFWVEKEPKLLKLETS